MEKNRCEGCIYWKSLSGYGGDACCHYILMEGHSRVRDGEKCCSFKQKRGLTNRVLTTMIKKEMYNLMQNEVEKMKIGVGAMSELLRMFYDSLIQQNFTPEQAIQLTSDYMKAVFGK